MPPCRSITRPPSAMDLPVGGLCVLNGRHYKASKRITRVVMARWIRAEVYGRQNGQMRVPTDGELRCRQCREFGDVVLPPCFEPSCMQRRHKPGPCMRTVRRPGCNMCCNSHNSCGARVQEAKPGSLGRGHICTFGFTSLRISSMHPHGPASFGSDCASVAARVRARSAVAPPQRNLQNRPKPGLLFRRLNSHSEVG